MSSLLSQIFDFVDRISGIQGSIGYVCIIIAIVIGYSWTTEAIFPTDSIQNSTHTKPGSMNASTIVTEDGKPDPPRNFTLAQLSQFDGSRDEKSGKDKLVYLSVNGIVFDVSKGRSFYGPGGPYEKFAGHECGVALAKMSFDTEFLDDLDGCTTKLNFGERTELDNWISKFRDYRNYPIVGKLIVALPDPTRVWTADELRRHDGSATDLPEGYASVPIYIGADDKVFDMSFGGVSFYGPGGPYHKFAGRDASRALALMSLDEKDLENPSVDDCTEKQLNTMQEWIKTFEQRKMYPVVGRLQK